jgi:hypothetical protein
LFKKFKKTKEKTAYSDGFSLISTKGEFVTLSSVAVKPPTLGGGYKATCTL